MVKIVTDSTCYISDDLVKLYDIRLVSLNILLNGKTYRELDMKNESFYEELDKCKELPTSSQPGMDEMLKTFKAIAEEGNDIVGIFLSSKMSGTYSTAHLIKEMILEEYPNINIEIIDSTTNCMEMGFHVLEAAKAAKDQKSINEVVEIAKETARHSRFLFVPDSLKYLKKGGRIGKASALVGTILKIMPILTVEDGVTTVFDKVRTKKKAVDVIINKVLSDVNKDNLGGIIVHHINCEDEGLELAKRLRDKLNTDINIQSIGPIIGLHVGPGSIGVAYFTK